MSLIISAPFRRRICAVFVAVSFPFLIFAGDVWSQVITDVGSSETFDIATWNIEWFGHTGANNGPGDVDQQRENVETVIRESGIDFWALQEISDSGQFQELLDSLGGAWDGILASTPVTQRIAFIYNTDVITVLNFEHILLRYSTGPLPPNGENFFAGRPPIEIEVDVSLPDTTVRLNLITLHMKCCSDASSRSRREKASEQLKAHIDFTPLATEPVIVLGDYNDFLIGSIGAGPSPYDNLSADPDNYQFPTLPLDQQNVSTWCGNSLSCTTGSTIDHIMITDELFSQYEAGSAARMGSVLTGIDRYVFTTSDHMPVFARFMFPTNTAVSNNFDLPSSLSINALYPNPVTTSLQLGFATRSVGSATVEVFDVLGRSQIILQTDVFDVGEGHRFSIDTSALAPGLYMVRISHGADVKHGRFVRVDN